MDKEPLDLLFVSPWPPSPATFGAQRRVEGLMTALSRRHRVSCIAVASPEFDRAEAERAIRAYCDEVVVLPLPRSQGKAKRLLQLRSLASRKSFERNLYRIPALQRAVDELLRRRRFDVVSVETPHFMQYRFRQAPPGLTAPCVLLDEHNVEFDLARQSKNFSEEALRWIHHASNWRKIRREEVEAWKMADGVAFTSQNDAERARSLLPWVRAAVIPNAAEIDYFQPRPTYPKPDGRTVLFFGSLDYFPNQDAMHFFLKDIWPRLETSHPRARLRVIGPRPTPAVLACRGPRIEVLGLVEDLRPHLAEAACIIAPLRVGGGTRLKILEGMAMAKAIVSTALGAEGIAVAHERELLIADEPAVFASAVGRVLSNPELGQRLGTAARALVEARYSWNAVTHDLEAFLAFSSGALRRSAPARVGPLMKIGASVQRPALPR
jgi:glycosyltransferase involved in cell wall biosynthesis